MKIALAGNPNCGKTALFNALTGAKQRVGNWPGVTVERKTGKFVHAERVFYVTDLPGIYSLGVADENSLDERIACTYLLSGEPDVVVNVIDASNLERNLYLTLQLIEMRIPVILAINMMDVVKRRGTQINLKKLSRELDCPVVAIVANRKQGIEELKKIIANTEYKKISRLQLPLTKQVSVVQQTLATAIRQKHLSQFSVDANWLATRLLEMDKLALQSVPADIVHLAKNLTQQIENELGEEVDILIADARYCYINQLAIAVTKLTATPRQNITQWLDRIVLNRYLGIPIFFFIMYCMFLFAINIAGAFQEFFNISSNAIFVNGTAYFLTQCHSPAWLTAILANGIGKGINTTVTFIPVIGGMFLFLSFLEDSGYMARAAFVMDRFMSALGLPGKSFVPMIVGFGCNVPAVMGARTLANPRDRILTILMMPFMSCGARLAIFAVFGAAFFPVAGQDIIFFLYILGILAAVLTGLLLRKLLLPGKPASLVMELPPYRMPTFIALVQNAWQRLKKFLTRAGKVIVPVCVLIGALNSISITGQLLTPQQSSNSILSEVGRVATPILAPMGVEQNNWPATMGLVTGVLAKEVVIGTLNTLYSSQAANKVRQEASHFNLWQGLSAAIASIPQNLSHLGSALRNPLAANEAPHEMSRMGYGRMYHNFDGKIGAFAYLLFILLYFPCISTMAATRREIGRGWSYFSMLWNTVLAYGMAVVCYQLLTMSRHPESSIVWALAIFMVFAAVIAGLKLYASRALVRQKLDPIGMVK